MHFIAFVLLHNVIVANVQELILNQFDLRAADLARHASAGSACSRGTATLYHSPSATPSPRAA